MKHLLAPSTEPCYLQFATQDQLVGFPVQMTLFQLHFTCIHETAMMYNILSYVSMGKINRQANRAIHNLKACYKTSAQKNLFWRRMEQQMAETLPRSRRQNAEHKNDCRNAISFTLFDRMLQISWNGLCHLLINLCKNWNPWVETQKNWDNLRKNVYWASLYFCDILLVPEMSKPPLHKSYVPTNNSN